MKYFLNIFLIVLLYESCFTPKKIVTSVAIIKPSDSIAIDAQNTGVDFIAHGNNPAKWNLEMDFDNNFVFSSSDHTDKIITLPVLPQKIADAAGETYFSSKGNQRMDITLMDGDCTSMMTTNPFVKSTTVKIGETAYTGCGNFLYNFRINDIWILDYIDYEKQYENQYPKGIPRLEFNLAEKKLTGSNGCSEIECHLEMRGNRIQFSHFFSPYSECENTRTAKIFWEYINNKLVEYYFKEGNLVLYLSNDQRLIFRKAD